MNAENEEDFLEQAAAEDESRGATPEAIKSLSETVHGLVDLRTRIEKGETLLATLKRQEENLVRNVIPGMLKQYRVTSMSLENDVKVTIEEKVFVRIPADKDTGDQEAIEATKKARTEALEFLMNHGGGSLVKEQTIIEEASQDVKIKIAELGYSYEDKVAVNTNSLTAWVKDVLGIKKGSVQRIRPEDFPKSMGLFQYSEAKVK